MTLSAWNGSAFTPTIDQWVFDDGWNPVKAVWAWDGSIWVLSWEREEPEPPTEIILTGGHCHDIQAAMDQAAAQGLKLRLNGTFYTYTHVYIPDGLVIDATGSKFYVNSESAVSNAVYNSGRFKNATNGDAPEYGQAGNFIWTGGELDGNGEGCMTFSHSPGYIIQNTLMYNYCSSANTGHAIEINSSGGVDNQSGPFTVQILNNTFRGTNRGQRSNSNDEPIHFDWNWDGSGSSEPVWTPGDPVSESTQVMCHNVLIDGNTFHRLSESAPWEFAKCAIGGHDSADAAVVAEYRHNHFVIVNNIIHGAVGSTGTNPDKGAIHMYRVRQCVAQNNQLHGGVQDRYITAEDATDATYCSATGNTSSNPTLAGNDIIVVQNA